MNAFSGKRRTLHFFTASWLLLVCGTVSTQTQTQTPPPQQTPVFRSRTTVVPLTVTVLDSKGVPIRDLKQSDFTVLENNRPREIVSFFPQEMKPIQGGVAPVAGLPRAPGEEMTPQKGRTFLIVLGEEQNLFHTLESAAEFVRESLLPQDAVGIMAFDRVTPLTLDHEAIAKIIERYKNDGQKIRFDYMLSQGKSLFGNSGRPKVEDIVKKMDNVMAGAGHVRSMQSLLVGVDTNLPQIAPPSTTGHPGLIAAETMEEMLDRLSGGSFAGLTLQSSRMKLFAGIEYLRYVDGEKHILFMTGADLAHDSDDAIAVGRRAADARVVVDVISGLGYNWKSRDVVDITGGYYTSLEMPKKALAKLDVATRFSYLLGYTPLNPELDGKFREVKVRVNRPGAVARFEHGYYANAEPDPLEIRDLLMKARLEGLLAYDSEAKDIGLRVSAFQLPKMGIQYETRIEIFIEATKLGFKQEGGMNIGRLELQVYAGDEKERAVGEFGERLDLEASEATLEAWKQDGIRRVVRLPVTSPPKFIKVVVYDYTSDLSGSFMLTMTTKEHKP